MNATYLALQLHGRARSLLHQAEGCRQDGGLAGPRRANDGHEAAPSNIQVDIPQARLRRVVPGKRALQLDGHVFLCACINQVYGHGHVLSEYVWLLHALQEQRVAYC